MLKPAISEARGSPEKCSQNSAPARTKRKTKAQDRRKSTALPVAILLRQVLLPESPKNMVFERFRKTLRFNAKSGLCHQLTKLPLVGAILLHPISSPESTKNHISEHLRFGLFQSPASFRHLSGKFPASFQQVSGSFRKFPEVFGSFRKLPEVSRSFRSSQLAQLV